MARRVGKERWSAKNDTSWTDGSGNTFTASGGSSWTDRNGETTFGMSEKGFTRGSAKGLLASDVSDLIEIRADNREEFQKAWNKALAAALEEVGLVAEGYAKRACPVDTGRLRNSITHVVTDGEVYIGTAVKYGKYVEKGTSRMKAQPFIEPAATQHGSTYLSIMQKHLGKP